MERACLPGDPGLTAAAGAAAVSLSPAPGAVARRGLLARAASLLALGSLLAACWQQSDVVRFAADGTIVFTADVTVTEPRFRPEEVERITADFAAMLGHAGWTVERRWVSREAPLRLAFDGRGNLHRLRSAPDFYELIRVSATAYEFRFFPAAVQGGTSSRRIAFEPGPGVRVVDELGRPVAGIAHVFGNLRYRVLLAP